MRQYWPGCLECQQPEGKEEWGDQLGDQQQFVGQTQDLPTQPCWFYHRPSSRLTSCLVLSPTIHIHSSEAPATK